MATITDTTILSPSLTADEALAKTQAELNDANNDFDRWISANPALATPTNVEFRLRQQTIKRLRLKLKEIKDIKQDYQNTLMVLSATPMRYVDPNVPTAFTMKKQGDIQYGKETMRVATKRTNRVSQRGA